MTTLAGRRLVLRPVVASDFAAWREVRRRSADWLLKWEAARVPGSPDTVEDRGAFEARCAARQRERMLGTGYGFGLFVDGCFAGEININAIQRGAFQSAYVGYWIDESYAGNGYMSEAMVLLARFAFEELHLHRLQVAIIPRNDPSNRVAQKLGLRLEGTALRYLEINGVWEDHYRYAMTVEDWWERRRNLLEDWILP